MTHIIVHAGYHKTGTTSLQDFMSANRAALAPHLRYFGKTDFRAAGAHARIYAQRPFPWRLWRFRRSFSRFLRPLAPDGTIILSRETFSGGMPGHRRLGGAMMMAYTKPATALAHVIIEELRRHFGPDTDITFFYTTRDTDPWLRSVHGHLLRSIRLTQGFDAFRANFPDLKGPAQEAADMAQILAPIPVITAALEDFSTHHEGPAAALLDLLDIPADLRATLKPAPRSNPGESDEMREIFRVLNTRKMSRGALRLAKQMQIRRRGKAK